MIIGVLDPVQDCLFQGEHPSLEALTPTRLAVIRSFGAGLPDLGSLGAPFFPNNTNFITQTLTTLRNDILII